MKKLFITSEASHSIERAMESDDEKRRSASRNKPRRKSEILPSERKKEKGTAEIRERKDSLRLRVGKVFIIIKHELNLTFIEWSITFPFLRIIKSYFIGIVLDY